MNINRHNIHTRIEYCKIYDKIVQQRKSDRHSGAHFIILPFYTYNFYISETKYATGKEGLVGYERSGNLIEITRFLL